MKNRSVTFTTIVLLLRFLALSPIAQAVSPAPDGGYPGGNTAEGQNALLSLSSGGYNTAVGYLSLRSDTTAFFNTAIGAGTLLANTGAENTATGAGALLSNTVGDFNTASGAFALVSNTNGGDNTATGCSALESNTTGASNTANGSSALFLNITGAFNTAVGVDALYANRTGDDNTAVGIGALELNTGARNTAVGEGALGNSSSGSSNTALGIGAGSNQSTGSNNIYIGDTGSAGESNVIAIGATPATGVPYQYAYIGGVFGATSLGGTTVFINSQGQLGISTSSRRFKQEIKPMDRASEALFALKPVTFRYKKEIDPAGIGQFGLVAEDVEKVNPDLVIRDRDGKPYTVRYDAINAMVLNEFLKEHRRVQELEKGMGALTAQLKEQAAQIQKVSSQLEMSRPPSRMAQNSP